MITILAFVLAAIFIYAGSRKITDAAAFYQSIKLYHLLPDAPAWYLAHYLPWLEIVLGLGLLWRRLRGAAALLVTVALLVFVAAITSAWWRGLDIDCGCFGKSEISNNYTWLLARDLTLLLASGYVAWSAAVGQVRQKISPA
jgi:uncharacterized membrane protein YphA (DoxX/SURF4 family)